MPRLKLDVIVTSSSSRRPRFWARAWSWAVGLGLGLVAAVLVGAVMAFLGRHFQWIGHRLEDGPRLEGGSLFCASVPNVT